MTERNNSKILNKKSLESIIAKLNNGNEDVYGKYVYNDFKILISRKNPFSNKERARRFYQKRRSMGLCIICGTKITKTNPVTKKPFRYCDNHRKLESTSRRNKRTVSVSKKKPVAKKK